MVFILYSPVCDLLLRWPGHFLNVCYPCKLTIRSHVNVLCYYADASRSSSRYSRHVAECSFPGSLHPVFDVINQEAYLTKTNGASRQGSAPRETCARLRRFSCQPPASHDVNLIDFIHFYLFLQKTHSRRTLRLLMSVKHLRSPLNQLLQITSISLVFINGRRR